MLNKNSNIILILLSLIGIILASYLFYNFLAKPIVESCYINSTINCDAVTKGSLSSLFGVPVSLIGLLGYIGILISTIFRRKKVVLSMATFGMVFCLYLTIQEVFMLRVICPVCLACQLVMLIVFVIALRLNFKLKKSSK